MTPASPPIPPAAGDVALREATYVLVKRGLYWPPYSQGYTGLLAEAGRYSEEDARAHSEHDGGQTSVMPASEAPKFAPACWPETKIAVLQEAIATLEARLAAETERADKLDRDLKAAVLEVGAQARARGEAEGRLCASETAGVVDGWRDRALKAESGLEAERENHAVSARERNLFASALAAAEEEIAAVDRALEGLAETPRAERVAHWIGVAAAADTRAAEAENSLAAETAAREAAERWAEGWHRVVETILTIVGLSPALGADEAAGAVRSVLAAAEAEAARMRAENKRLQQAYGCHLQADAYRDTFPEDEVDAAGLRKSETFWRLTARAVIGTDDPLAEAYSLAAMQIPAVVAERDRVIREALKEVARAKSPSASGALNMER